MRKTENISRWIAMLTGIALWICSMVIATLHHHESAHEHSSLEQYAHRSADHCQHHDTQDAAQDCGLCFLIHNAHAISITYFPEIITEVYPIFSTKQYAAGFITAQQDRPLRAGSLRGPPIG